VLAPEQPKFIKQVW